MYLVSSPKNPFFHMFVASSLDFTVSQNWRGENSMAGAPCLVTGELMLDPPTNCNPKIFHQLILWKHGICSSQTWKYGMRIHNLFTKKQVIFRKNLPKKKGHVSNPQGFFWNPPQDPPHTQDHVDTLRLATILADGAPLLKVSKKKQKQVGKRPKNPYPIPWIILVG